MKLEEEEKEEDAERLWSAGPVPARRWLVSVQIGVPGDRAVCAKVGSGSPRMMTRTWTFKLYKISTGWVINTVDSR